MSARSASVRRCPRDHKATFRSWRTALQAAVRLPDPGRPYWCVVAGGYHIRRGSQSDYDRRRATYDDPQREVS